jgi:alpha-tubulin suppressor-like RCC1 family protein
MQGRGVIYSYGLGKNGELGNRKRNDREIVPFRVEGLPPCISAKAGGSFSLVLSVSGEIWACGKGKSGRSGVPDTIQFIRISGLPRISQISAGYWHSLALDEGGRVWSTGYNSYGQLGLGHSTDAPNFTLTEATGKRISAGGHYSLLITDSGVLLSCGTSKVSGHNENFSRFTQIPNLENVEFIDAGQIHAACVSQGKVYTWGNNSWGQLGHSNLKNSIQPKEVLGLDGLHIIAVSCSKGEKFGSTGCITQDFRVFMWGCGYKGKLGLDSHWSHEDPADRHVPELISNFNSDQIELGGIHSSSIFNGTLFTWGCGSDGRIGHPEVEGHRYLYKEPLPRPIANIPKVVMTSSSYYHNIVLTE